MNTYGGDITAARSANALLGHRSDPPNRELHAWFGCIPPRSHLHSLGRSLEAGAASAAPRRSEAGEVSFATLAEAFLFVRIFFSSRVAASALGSTGSKGCGPPGENIGPFLPHDESPRLDARERAPNLPVFRGLHDHGRKTRRRSVRRQYKELWRETVVGAFSGPFLELNSERRYALAQKYSGRPTAFLRQKDPNESYPDQAATSELLQRLLVAAPRGCALADMHEVIVGSAAAFAAQIACHASRKNPKTAVFQYRSFLSTPQGNCEVVLGALGSTCE